MSRIPLREELKDDPLPSDWADTNPARLLLICLLEMKETSSGSGSTAAAEEPPLILHR